MAQRRIVDYFPTQGTIRTVGDRGSRANRDHSSHFQQRQGRNFRDQEGPAENTHGSGNSNSNGNGRPYRGSSNRAHPYRGRGRGGRPPAFTRQASSNITDTDGETPGAGGADPTIPQEATRARRAQIFSEVHRETPTVLRECPAGSSSSTYYASLLPKIVPRVNPNPPTPISIIDGDTYSVAHEILLADPSRAGKVTVLNMASDLGPGGGCKKGSLAQEESLCYRSTLYHSIDKPDYYPLPPLAGIYSPGVVVYRKDMKDGFMPYEDKNEWFVVSVVSLAGLRRPELSPDETEFATPAIERLLANKIRQTLRIAAVNSMEYIILGALGCGAFRNPPEAVAKTFKQVLSEDEWKGVFKGVVFAVMGGNGRQWLSANANAAEILGRQEESSSNNNTVSPGKKNYEVFKEMLDGVVVG